MQSQLKEEFAFFSFITEYDKEALTTGIIQNYFCEDTDIWNLKCSLYKERITARKLRDAERSLCLKHMMCLQNIANGIHEYGLILEDDAKLCDDFYDISIEAINRLPSDWDLYFPNTYDGLFGKQIDREFEYHQTGAYRISYFITKKAAQKLIEYIETFKFTLPLDFEYNWAFKLLDLKIIWGKYAYVESVEFPSSVQEMNKLLIDKTVLYTNEPSQKFDIWTEFGLQTYPLITKELDNASLPEIKVEKILVIPTSYTNNLWHILHSLFVTYKYIHKNHLFHVKDVCFIFLTEGIALDGDIRKCQYFDILSEGMKFNAKSIKDIQISFENHIPISYDELFVVEEAIHFDREEPLLRDFCRYIINNLNIKKTTACKNTFVLRRGPREITNIQDVQQLQGFDFVYLEDLTVKEQLTQLINTNILVGVHGAGLSWCIFMSPGTLLLEIYPGCCNTDNYIRWCNLIDVKYERMEGTIESGDVNDFRNTTVRLETNQIEYIQNLVNKNT